MILLSLSLMASKLVCCLAGTPLMMLQCVFTKPNHLHDRIPFLHLLMAASIPRHARSLATTPLPTHPSGLRAGCLLARRGCRPRSSAKPSRIRPRTSSYAMRSAPGRSPHKPLPDLFLLGLSRRVIFMYP